MKKAEMEERIKKLEAQVDLLTRLMPQYQNSPYPIKPQWPGTYADTAAFPQYDHSLPQPQYPTVMPDGTRLY